MKQAIHITVCYALPDQVWSVSLMLAPPYTIERAISLSQFLDQFKNLELEVLNTGVFGKLAPLSYELTEGDRVEIYRHLSFDPKQSRRRRAIHRQKLRTIKKKVPINDVTI